MRMIAGVLEPDPGDAKIAGHSIVTDRRLAQAAIGYLPEGAPLYLDMTPIGFLRFIADAHGLSKQERTAAIERVVADARIGNVTQQQIGTLSKGYRRRVGLASAILHDPPVLVLDEPLDGLDPRQKQAIRALVARMAKTKSILISTHTLEEVPAMCSRVILIDQGCVLADDTPDGLAAKHPDGIEGAFIALTSKEELVQA